MTDSRAVEGRYRGLWLRRVKGGRSSTFEATQSEGDGVRSAGGVGAGNTSEGSAGLSFAVVSTLGVGLRKALRLTARGWRRWVH